MILYTNRFLKKGMPYKEPVNYVDLTKRCSHVTPLIYEISIMEQQGQKSGAEGTEITRSNIMLNVEETGRQSFLTKQSLTCNTYDIRSCQGD